MSRRVLGVGVDPAKRVHRAVAVLYPDRIIFDEVAPNDLRAFELLDDKLERLADRHRAALICGVADHRRYGQILVEALQARGRAMRVVSPLWTDRQKDFYGQDKDDAIDARAFLTSAARSQEGCCRANVPDLSRARPPNLPQLTLYPPLPTLCPPRKRRNRVTPSIPKDQLDLRRTPSLGSDQCETGQCAIKRASREAGSSLPKAPQGHLRTWMLLAST